MPTRLLLNLLALACVLLVSGARADCNRPATDYERQDCAFKADKAQTLLAKYGLSQ